MNQSIKLSEASLRLNPRVFVTQGTDLDLSKAARFGELEVIMPTRTNIVAASNPTFWRIFDGLKDFNGDTDYLLPLGDPVVIGLTFLSLAEKNLETLRILKWDRHLNDYYVVKLNPRRKP